MTLNEEEIQVLLQKTRYSRQEIEQNYEKFIKDCPNGELTLKQLIKNYKVLYPLGKPKKFCKYVYHQLVDGEKRIGFVQYLKALSVATGDDMNAKIEMVFKIYDTKKDNTLDEKELTKVIIAINELLGKDYYHNIDSPKTQAKNILNKLSKNRGTIIRLDEFIDAIKNDDQLKKFLVRI